MKHCSIVAAGLMHSHHQLTARDRDEKIDRCYRVECMGIDRTRVSTTQTLSV